MMIDEKKPHARIDFPASFAAEAKNYFILRDKQAVAVDMQTWARWFSTADRKIALTKVRSMLVSTVFLGCNHRFGGNGPPLIYETMIFDDDQSGSDRYCKRYSSYEDAEIGHAATVRAIKKGKLP